MNVVDSSAWLEYFADGPNAGRFARAVEDFENLLVPSIVILEVHKRLLQQRGEREALEKTVLMAQTQVVSLDEDLAREAALLGHKTGLPLADSVILATARKHDALLWTQDEHFEGLEKVRYFPHRRRGKA